MTLQFLRFGLPVVIIVVLILSIVSRSRVYSSSAEHHQTPTPLNTDPDDAFSNALYQHASPDRLILLSLVDTGFLDMAVNFYRTSLRPFGIVHFLFLSIDPAACTTLQLEGNLHCVVYDQGSGGGGGGKAEAEASEYGSDAFRRKMNVRTRAILHALRLGYTVIHSDVDVVFFADPISDLISQCPDNTSCDLAIMWDHVVYNAGFLIARPHRQTLTLYERMLSLADEQPKVDDQQAINRIIKKLVGRHQLQVRTLDKRRYLNGYEYFEIGRRMFKDNTTQCVHCMVLHNNWIVSKEAKIYRFKEQGLWLAEDDSYFNDAQRTYLIYDNVPVSGVSTERTAALERNALRNALAIGRILRRSVILPTFTCVKSAMVDTRCPLNERFRISDFDKRFAGEYREHVFLNNPLVPDSVKGSLSHAYTIRARLSDTDGNQRRFVRRPADTELGASEHEIRKWFEHEKKRVLVFESLYFAFADFQNEEDKKRFADNVTIGLTEATYRQYPNAA